MENAMQKKIYNFLKKHHMIEENDHILVGFSGGADSVCLLLVLKSLRREMHFKVTAVHVEHGIRGEESLRDAAFARQFCEREQIEFVSYSVDVPRAAGEAHQTLEEAARRLRYECFYKACERLGADKIAVAHHGDDCAETMLFHLSRGTGIRGLCGIVPVRDRIIRPLLCVTRAEIEAYLRECGQTYCTDSTNFDTSYARNRIRGKILPQMKEINPKTVPHMVRTAGELKELSDFLEESAGEAGKAGVLYSYEGDQVREIRIRRKEFLQIHPVLQKVLLHQLLGKAAGSRKDITAQHIGAVRELFFTQVGKVISLPYHLEAEKEYDAVLIRSGNFGRKPREADAAEPGTVLLPGETVWVNGMQIHAEILAFDGNYEKIPQKSYTKWFDYDKIKNTVLLRKRRPGDFLQVNASGGHKKLKDLLIDAKVPRAERDKVLLVADASHVIWVVGWRISEAYKVTQETKRILAVCVNGGKEDE